jgi:hypothetical protein
MKAFAHRATITLVWLVLAGCSTVTPTTEMRSGYAVFDINPGPEATTARIAEAVKVALQANLSQVRIEYGIPPSPLPDKAPRFQLTSPFKGSRLEALAAASGQSLQVANCEGAILTANGGTTSMRQYGEGSTYFTCLMPYQGGYALNIYTTFSKASGAFNTQVLAATLLRPVLGDTSDLIPRTISQIVEGVRKTGSTVTLVEAYP